MKIPYGETSTYLKIALRLGDRSLSRAVGMALGANPLPLIIPCHRVIRSDGSLGGYSGGITVKRNLLRLEGSL
jgi:methylated-DNA-[protein]-cysteine S-methyltransferase